jgi:nucleoid DNA-binding protein
MRGRNPKTGTSIELGERRIPYFRASKALNFKINH